MVVACVIIWFVGQMAMANARKCPMPETSVLAQAACLLWLAIIMRDHIFSLHWDSVWPRRVDTFLFSFCLCLHSVVVCMVWKFNLRFIICELIFVTSLVQCVCAMHPMCSRVRRFVLFWLVTNCELWFWPNSFWVGSCLVLVVSK